MPTRPAVFARKRWYPSTEEACRARIDELALEAAHLEAPADLPEIPCAGLVPHAGWAYSGLTAAAVFRLLAKRTTPDVVVFFGACHVPGVPLPVLWDGGAWETPLGPAETDRALAQALDFVDARTEPHTLEHSVEVQLPFVKRFWPAARIVVLMVPPGDDSAIALGKSVAALSREGSGVSVLAIGSTDMTHYGPRYGFTPRGIGREAHRWVVEENDRRMLALIRGLDVEGVRPEAATNHNACSVGAIQATLAYARERGASRGSLVHYTTSQRVHPQEVPEDFVGYSGFVF